MQLRLHCPVDHPDTPGPELRDRLNQMGLRVMEEHSLRGTADIVLTDDAQLHQLNADFRGVDRPTDVLSFSMVEGQPLVIGAEDARVAGEIYVSLDRARSQALELSVPVAEELARLMVHGLLHLAGFDHDTEETLRFMEEETQRFLDLGDLHAARPDSVTPTPALRADGSCPGGQLQ